MTINSLQIAIRNSKDDERHNRPNPSKIPFDGVIRSNLTSYRDAIKRYLRFLDSGGEAITPSASSEIGDDSQGMVERVGQRIGLERDMQAALRIEIQQLESGISIIDDGAERSVDSDFDGKARAAARMVPNLILRKYSVQFTFSDGHI